jgi:outer membrane protein TolC
MPSRWSRGCLVLVAACLAGCYAPLADPAERDTVASPRPAARTKPAGARPRALVADGQGRLRLGLGDVLGHLLSRTGRVEVIRLTRKAIQAEGAAAAEWKAPELRVQNLSGSVIEPSRTEGSSTTGFKHYGPNVGKLQAGVRWKPPFPSEHRARRDEATGKAEEEVQRLTLEVLDLVAEARQIYAQIQSVDQTLRVYDRLKDLKRRHLELREKQARNGLLSRTEADMTALDGLDAEWRITAARSERGRLSARLMQILEVPGVRELEVDTEPVVPADALPPLQDLVRQAQSSHPALLALHQERRSRHASLWLARSARYPWLSFVEAGYDANEDTPLSRLTLSFGIRLPAFDGNRGQVHLQQQRLALTEGKIKARRTRIAAEVVSAYRQAELSRAAVEHYQKVVSPRAEAILARARAAALREGVDLDQVFRLEARVVTIAIDAVRESLALALARIALDRAAAVPVWRRHGIVYDAR